jgi:uncharacterized protein YpmS
MVASRSVIALTSIFCVVFAILLAIIIRFAMMFATEVLYLQQQQVVLENCAKVVEPGKWIEMTYCKEAMLDYRAK